MVQGTRRQRHAGHPEPVLDAGKSRQVELLLDTGRDMLPGSGQVTRLFAVRRGQQRQELAALVSGRDGVLLEEPDGEGRCLFADASALPRRDGERGPQYRALHGRHLARACGWLSNQGTRCPGCPWRRLLDQEHRATWTADLLVAVQDKDTRAE